MRKPGYALATVLVLTGICLFGVGALVSVSVLESKIARSHQEGTKAYYVAEAGVEDALWRINNTPSYSSGLTAGTLSATYSATDKPIAGQGFTVTLSSTSPGYGKVEVTGYSDNGSFKAQRRVINDIFQGGITSPTGSNAMMSGGGLSITNGSSQITINNGDLYAGGAVSIHSATVDLDTNHIFTPSSYTNTNGTVTNGGVSSTNTPPAAPALTVPGIDFTYYASNNNVSYTPAQFQALVTGGGSTITIPGPVTYINGNLSMSNWAKDKTLNITGMLVINGSLSVTGAASNLNVNVADPGDGKAGIFIRTTMNNSSGNWVIDGTFYSSGSMTLTNSQTITVSGGLVSGGSIQMNTGLELTINYVGARVGATFGSGGALAVGVEHWEEEY